MDYYKYRFKTKSNQNELILAFLSPHPFESFEELEYGVDAYIIADSLNNHLDELVKEDLKSIDYELIKEFIPYQNWNALWESNFQPILINDFCSIRADFHPAPTGVKHDLIINPKMAFGTGHHETTHMVVETMENINFKGAKVLDYGCGTGVLAILAARLGATQINAVDIEQPSYENTIENAKINAVDNIHTIHGTLEDIDDGDYDIILANINRNIILGSLTTLYSKLKNNGILVVSGFLKEDEQLLITNATQNKFSQETIKRKNNWICIVFRRI